EPSWTERQAHRPSASTHQGLHVQVSLQRSSRVGSMPKKKKQSEDERLAEKYAKEDAEREAKNKLKLEMEEFNDVWEEVKVKVRAQA
ncbi:MAG: hypothetical protein ACPIOQ_39205, partial [Promethearchaeia archaeon]